MERSAMTEGTQNRPSLHCVSFRLLCNISLYFYTPEPNAQARKKDSKNTSLKQPLSRFVDVINFAITLNQSSVFAVIKDSETFPKFKNHIASARVDYGT